MAQVLNYGLAPSWLRRHRKAILALLFAIAGATGMVWGPPLWRQWRIQRCFSACLLHVQAADGIAFEGSCEEDRVVVESTGVSTSPVAAVQGRCYTAPQYASLLAAIRPTERVESRYPATVFLHERRTRSGKGRLVALHVLHVDYVSRRVIAANLSTDWLLHSIDVTFSAEVFDPDARKWDALSLGSVLVTPLCTTTDSDAVRRSVVRIFSGTSDPGDTSHFSIRYSVGDRTGVIDAYLTDSAEIELHDRNSR